MGWLENVRGKKKEEIPAMFKDKSEDDILQMMKEAADAKTKNTELSAKVTEQNATVERIQTEFEAVKGRLAAAELNRPKPPVKPEDDTSAPTADNLLNDPKKVLDTHTAPTTALALETAKQTARILAQQQLNNQDMANNGKTMDGRLFMAWGAELDAESRKYQPIQLITPAAWIGIYLYLKGVHADELRDPETRKKKYNFLEPPATPGIPLPGEGKPKDGPESLTDAEKHVADKMHISYENYAKRKAAMQFAPQI